MTNSSISTDSPKSSTPTTPLVSVICRTIGRPELETALQSIADQTHEQIELVLVDASGNGEVRKRLDSFDFSAVSFVSTGQKLLRAAAANAGLENAQGQYLMFLDEDDWISPQHIELLLQAIDQSDEYRAAYSNVQKTSQAGEPLEQVFNQGYDPVLLIRDNYIPIHAMLFDASLVASGCRFDERFDNYEDWDFWLQLSQHTAFLHHNEITAFYREGGESETANGDENLRYQSDSVLGKARATMFDKWSQTWTGDELNQLMGHLINADRSARLDSELREKIRETEELHQRLESTTADLDSAQIQVDELEHSLKETQSHLAHVEKYVRHVEESHRLIEDSIFWRATAPLRWLRDKVRGNQVQKKTEVMSKQEVELAAAKKLEEFLQSGKSLKFSNSSSAQVSIILVFFNKAPLSFLCLQSLLRNADVDFELIIIDNASSDETSQLLQRINGAVIERNAENLGFVKAVNQGVGLASAPHILLLNNDAQLETEALSAALTTLQSDTSIGAVGAKIKLLDGSLQEAGSIIFNDGSCRGYGRGDDPDAPPYRFRRDVDYCSGAFLLFRRADFDALNGFDEAYAPAYYEESDFCVRLRKKGLRTVYEPAAAILHYEFASSGGMKNAQELQLKHRELFCQRHPEFLARQLPPAEKNLLAARTSNSLPNILVIDDRVPHPSLGAGFPRCAKLLNTLADFGNVCLYPLQFPKDDWNEIYRTLDSRIEVILDSGRRGLRRFLAERRNAFDTIIVSREHNMAYIKQTGSLIANTDARIIYDAEALTAPREIMKRELNGAWLSDRDKQRLLEDELDLARYASTILAVSEGEAVYYREHGYKDVRVLGHAIEPEPTPNDFAARSGILFVGALRDEGSPNVDSLVWFVQECLPLIEETIPDIELHVVGGNSAPSLAQLRHSRIKFHGRLNSLVDKYNQCRVFIAPTRFAAGIPHKVHEAAAQGLPSVTTTLLARQLDWQHGQELLQGDTAEDFAEACIKLYQDEDCWNSVRKAGVQAISQDCSPTVFRETLEALVTNKE